MSVAVYSSDPFPVGKSKSHGVRLEGVRERDLGKVDGLAAQEMCLGHSGSVAGMQQTLHRIGPGSLLVYGSCARLR